jgi:hypothetical protein
MLAQPSELRNTSGKSLSGPEAEDFAKLRSLVYNKINSVILESLRARSHYGATMRFGDGVVRTGHPGVLIESMDFQELAAWLAMRSAIATYPCPKCLVPKHELALLSKRHPLRTPAKMKAVLRKARSRFTKRDREEVLKNSGLHNVEVSHPFQVWPLSSLVYTANIVGLRIFGPVQSCVVRHSALDRRGKIW